MRNNARTILLIAGLFAALIALNFLFFVDRTAEQESEFSANRSSYRSTPYGTLAFYTLLKESGFSVSRFEKPFTDLRPHDPDTLVIISPPEALQPSAEEFGSLEKWVQAGGVAVIIDREINVKIGGAEINTVGAVSSSTPRAIQPTSYTRGVDHLSVSQYATRVEINSKAAAYHIGDGKSVVLADARVGKGRLVLLTDPHVVANNGLPEADNVVAALNLFSDQPGGSIGFDEYHQGYGASTASGGLMAYFRGTPVPWMMAQAGLIAVLVVYSYGRRFGRPIPLRQERRTTNLEFVSSMANITRLAHASGLAMENIYSEFRKRLCRFSRLPVKVDTTRLADVAARRAGIEAHDLAKLLSRCEEVASGDKISDSELLALVSRIREIEARLGS
ncbi:MAG TPA: DUF4350 domain-containing protein [Blastocatellia bacterium]|nr:DUF4350 domain-containing protein [Blastocatellia bacterium]